MTRVIKSERIGKQGTLRVGASATIFDDAREKVLLTRRADNGTWCLPGGGMDPGESGSEACIREVLEETGLQVRVIKLIGVYTTPNIIVEYPDGNRIQPVALNFEAVIVGGELGLSDETTAYGYFTKAEMDQLDLFGHHRDRILRAFENKGSAFFD